MIDADAVDTTELTQIVEPLVLEARDLTINTEERYQDALRWLRDVLVPARKRVETFFKPLKAAAKATHTALCDREREVLASIPEDLVREKCIVWQRAELARREADARRAAEEAQAQADAERMAAAERALDAGDLAQAEQLIETPAVVEAPPPVARPLGISGVSAAQSYRAQITDMQAFVRWCLQSPERLEYLSVNQAALDGLARRLRMAFRVPGVAVEPVQTLRVGRR